MNRPTPLRAAILAQLQSGPMNARQIADALSTTRHNAMNAIRVMCDQGLIRRRGFSGSPPGQLFVIVEAAQ